MLKCQGSSSFSKTRSISFFVEMHGVEQVNKIRLQGLLLDQTQLSYFALPPKRIEPRGFVIQRREIYENDARRENGIVHLRYHT